MYIIYSRQTNIRHSIRAARAPARVQVLPLLVTIISHYHHHIHIISGSRAARPAASSGRWRCHRCPRWPVTVRAAFIQYLAPRVHRKFLAKKIQKKKTKNQKNENKFYKYYINYCMKYELSLSLCLWILPLILLLSVFLSSPLIVCHTLTFSLPLSLHFHCLCKWLHVPLSLSLFLSIYFSLSCYTTSVFLSLSFFVSYFAVSKCAPWYRWASLHFCIFIIFLRICVLPVSPYHFFVSITIFSSCTNCSKYLFISIIDLYNFL